MWVMRVRRRGHFWRVTSGSCPGGSRGTLDPNPGQQLRVSDLIQVGHWWVMNQRVRVKTGVRRCRSKGSGGKVTITQPAAAGCCALKSEGRHSPIERNTHD